MSTVGVAPRLPLIGPLPVAPAFNIFTVALDLDDPVVRAQLGFAEEMEFRWGTGVEVLPRPSDRPYGWAHCLSGTMREKEIGTARDWATFDSFMAYVPDFCTGMGMGPWEAFKERANSVLLATEAYAAERQLAYGLPADNNPSLNDTNLVVLDTDVGPTEGLALLENAIGQTGRAGIIHATPAIGTMWAANRLLLWTGDVIRTVATRTPVVLGHGYIGTDPDAAVGPSDDKEWAFATGPVFAGRGELIELSGEISETLDRSNNDVNYIAERAILVGWDTVLQAGVLIDRSATP